MQDFSNSVNENLLMPYDPKLLDEILKKCYELIRKKGTPELYTREIEDLFTGLPIKDMLKYMLEKKAIKPASTLMGSPGDYNFFDSQDFLNNGGFQRISEEEQAFLQRQNKLQSLKEQALRDERILENRIKKATLISNKIALISAIISMLSLAFSIYQTINNDGLEKRLNKLETRKPIVDTLKSVFYLNDKDATLKPRNKNR